MGLLGKAAKRPVEVDKKALDALREQMIREQLAQQEAEQAKLQIVEQGEIRYTIVVAASGAKGGFLRDSHPEIASGVIYGKCTSMEGLAYTTVPSTKEKLTWNDPSSPEDTMLDATIAISMSLEEMAIFEAQFNARPESSLSGRAVEFDIITSDTFTMNVSGIFFANGVKWIGDFVAPKGNQPATAEEQRELARGNRAASIQIRTDRIAAGRAARQGARNIPANTITTAGMEQTTEAPAEIPDADLNQVGA